MADEKEVWRFEPYCEEESYGDIMCDHGSARRCIATFVSRADAERIIKAVNGEPPAWTKAPPADQGEYWHWNGDESCAPLPTFVLYSGTSGKCFVSAGQLGLACAYNCDDYGGWWLKMQTPEIPKAVNGDSDTQTPERT